MTRLFGPGYRSIFINVNEDCRYGDVILEKEEIRLLRRTVRDRLFRGATPEFTLHLWETVRANEEKNIFPNAARCDLHLESFLEYEPFLLSRSGVGMLESVPKDSRYRPAADEVLKELRFFDCPYFEETMIPKNSLFREFIGGKE